MSIYAYVYIYIYMHMCTCGVWTEQTGFGSASIVFFSHWRPYPWCWLWAGLIFPGTWMPYQNCQRHDWFSCALDKSGSCVAFSTSCCGWDCKLYGLPDFNHENPIVWQGLMQWVLLGLRIKGVHRRCFRIVVSLFKHHVEDDQQCMHHWGWNHHPGKSFSSFHSQCSND